MTQEDTILRGLEAISRDGLDGAITPRALYAMLERGHIKIQKIGGKFTTTRRRIRQQFEDLMDGNGKRR
jgi:hypothetical protein